MLFRKAAAVWWYVARAGMFQEHLLRCLNRFAQGRLDRGEGTFDGRVVGQRLELVERLVACQARRSDQRIQHRIRAFGNAEGVATHLLPNTARNRTDAVEERGSPSEGLKLLADGQLDVKFSRVPRSGRLVSLDQTGAEPGVIEVSGVEKELGQTVVFGLRELRQQFVAALPDELDLHTFVAGPPRPGNDAIGPALLRRLAASGPPIGKIQRNARDVAGQLGVPVERGSHGFVELRPLRVAEGVKVFRLPSQLRGVRQHRIGFHAGVGSPLAVES